MSRLAIVVVGAVCFLLIPVSEAASKCTSGQAQCAVEIGGQCDPNTGRWFYGKVYGKARRRHHGGLPRLRFAQVVSKAQVIAKLLVGFSDDRGFFVQLLVLLVFFVLVIIIVGMSRRHRVTAHDGDETPNVLGDPWSHF